jgi:hypothetical protein
MSSQLVTYNNIGVNNLQPRQRASDECVTLDIVDVGFGHLTGALGLVDAQVGVVGPLARKRLLARAVTHVHDGALSVPSASDLSHRSRRACTYDDEEEKAADGADHRRDDHG